MGEDADPDGHTLRNDAQDTNPGEKADKFSDKPSNANSVANAGKTDQPRDKTHDKSSDGPNDKAATKSIDRPIDKSSENPNTKPNERRQQSPSDSSGNHSTVSTLRSRPDYSPRETAKELPRDTKDAPPVPVAPKERDQQVIVETETVPTVPTIGVLNPGLPNALRVKRSQDSVPRLPSNRGSTKKRSQRMAQGSKADFFAAKVADAVDEQDSSGSDETFVYETPQGPPLTYSDSFRRTYTRSASDASFQNNEYHPHLPQSGQGGYQPNNFPTNYQAYQGHASQGQGPGPSTGYGPAGYLPPAQSSYFVEDPSHDSESTNAPESEYDHPGSFRPPNMRNLVVPKRKSGNPDAYASRYRYGGAAAGAANAHGANLSSAGGHSAGGVPATTSTNTPTSSATQIESDADETNHWYPWHHSRRPSRTHSIRPDEAAQERDGNDSIRAKHTYLQRWRAPAQSHFEDVNGPNNYLNGNNGQHTSHRGNGLGNNGLGSGGEDDERASLLRGRPSLYNYHSSLGSRRWNQNQNPPGAPYSSTLGPGDVPVPEYTPAEPNFAKYNAHVSLATRALVCLSLVMILILSMIFVGGLVLAAGRPLRDFDVVSLSDVLVSDRELAFSLITRAQNPGIFAKVIETGELDVFATTTHAKKAQTEASLAALLAPATALDAARAQVVLSSTDDDVKRTVLLGVITELESPMVFNGGFSSATQWRTAAAKLLNPLANNTDLWAEISAHEFDLTIKGVLNYRVLGNEYRETVSRTYHVLAPDFYDDIHHHKLHITDFI